jgi:hypothetical protein
LLCGNLCVLSSLLTAPDIAQLKFSVGSSGRLRLLLLSRYAFLSVWAIRAVSVPPLLRILTYSLRQPYRGARNSERRRANKEKPFLSPLSLYAAYVGSEASYDTTSCFLRFLWPSPRAGKSERPKQSEQRSRKERKCLCTALSAGCMKTLQGIYPLFISASISSCESPSRRWSKYSTLRKKEETGQLRFERRGKTESAPQRPWSRG